jgi:hypothetical protein
MSDRFVGRSLRIHLIERTNRSRTMTDQREVTLSADQGSDVEGRVRVSYAAKAILRRLGGSAELAEV